MNGEYSHRELSGWVDSVSNGVHVHVVFAVIVEMHLMLTMENGWTDEFEYVLGLV